MLERLSFLVLGCVIAFSGCTTSRTTHTARTGMEQLLISNAVDQTLDQLPLPPVANRKVFLEEKYLDCVDKGYLIASLRQRLLNAGAHLTTTRENSELTIEVRSGGVGTDIVDRFVGLPGVALPGPVPFDLPEIRVYERSTQFGTAKIGIVAVDSASGQVVFDGGKQVARSDDSRWSMLGIGPFEHGSVRREIHEASRQRYTSDETIIR